LYLNVDGLANLAIADGTTCRFTRVIGGGVEAMASELAARRSISLESARALLASVDLSVPAALEPAGLVQEPAPAPDVVGEQPAADDVDPTRATPPAEEPAKQESPLTREQHEAREASMGYAETIAAVGTSEQPADVEEPTSDADIRALLERGVREISGEIRNSLDFHRTQDQGGEIAHVSLSGAALDLPGFSAALQTSLGIEVRRESVGLADAELEGRVSTHRLAVAAGLATIEAPR
jgi:Tfp pilus assembly PilM family ATPase